MTVSRIRFAGILSIALVLSACGSSNPSATGSGAPSTAAPSAASATPSTGPSEASEPTPPPTSPPAAGQTDTEWGRIWDTVPAGFPTYPGATSSEEAATGPASAAYVVEGAEPEAIATWYQEGFEAAGYHTDALSGPFEDGGYSLDDSGEDPACLLSLTITPLGGTTSLLVLYGAACPHE